VTSTSTPGARWIRAALQVNPYGYQGRDAPSDSFASEADYNAALLARCKDLGIELIAITDHWCVDTARGLVDDAAASGIVALPGFEANSSEGVHLLVIFETGTDFADINAAIGVCGATPGCANGTAGAPFKDILKAMADRGSLVVPAHVNVPNAGMLMGRSGQPLVNMVTDPRLHAIAVMPSVDEGFDQAAIVAGRRPYDRPHPLAVIHADDVSKPDTLDTEGAATWFKVSFTRLESLKLAVRTPTTRVALEDPAATPRWGWNPSEPPRQQITGRLSTASCAPARRSGSWLKRSLRRRSDTRSNARCRTHPSFATQVGLSPILGLRTSSDRLRFSVSTSWQRWPTTRPVSPGCWSASPAQLVPILNTKRS